MAIKPGVYYDLPMDVYHADPALSRSDIVRLNLSPALYRNYVDQDKPEYRIGRALHGLVLQGIPLIVNESDGRTKPGKAFQVDYPDAVTPTMAEMINGMAKQCKPFFVDGQAEVSFFWENDEVMFKCRPDWISNGTIYDFKSTRQSLEDFHWDVRKFHYDVQHVHYLRGVEQHMPIFAFKFVVVEKTVPYRVGIFEIVDLEKLEKAENLISKSLATYRECLLTDTWDMPDMEIHVI